MIPRSLVPRDVRPPAETPVAPPRRLTTLLDDRMIVAANLPHIALDTRSSIPTHMPLDVLAARQVIPRDMPTTPFDEASLHPDYAPLTVMDQRITVPAALPVVELHGKGPVSAYELPEGLEPDVLNSGDVNLMVEPVEAPKRDWNWIARTGSIAAHAVLIIFIIFQSKFFPYRGPSQQQIDLARKQLNFIYMPPDVRGTPRTVAPASPQIRVDPRLLRRIAPSELQPLPGPKVPEHVVRNETPVEAPPDLPPPVPQPQAQAPNKTPDFLKGTVDEPKPQSSTSTGLNLPRTSSPGRALQESEEGALRGNGGTSRQFGAQGSGGGGPGGGGGQGLSGALEMLTPTEGVDFSNYLARVVASVKRNWESIMPESARMGDRGRVILQFRILRNGGVPDAEPQLMGPSGKEPLDRAALSSIRASSPFEPLPPAFSGPYIELRFSFFYNLPLNAQ
jgi:TonB family protein